MNIASSGAFTSPTIEARILLTAENQMAAGIASARRDLQQFAADASKIQAQVQANIQGSTGQFVNQMQQAQAQLQAQARQTQAQAGQTQQQAANLQQQAQAAVNAHAASFMQQQQQARQLQSTHAQMASQAKQLRQQQVAWSQAQAAAGTQQIQQQRQIQRQVRTTGASLGSMFTSMVASATAAATAIGRSMEAYVDTAQERARGEVVRTEMLEGGQFTPQQINALAEKIATQTGAPSTEAMKNLVAELSRTVQVRGGTNPIDQLATNVNTLLDLSVRARMSPEEMADWRTRIRFRPSQASRYFERIDPEFFEKMGINREYTEDLFESWKNTPDLIFKEMQRMEAEFAKRFTTPGGYQRSQAPFAAENRLYREFDEFSEDMGDHYRPMWDELHNSAGRLLEMFNKLGEFGPGSLTSTGLTEDRATRGGREAPGKLAKDLLQAGVTIGTGIGVGGGIGALVGGAIGMLGGPVGVAAGAAGGAALGGLIASFTELLVLNPKLRADLAKTGRSIAEFTTRAWTWANETHDAIAKGGSVWELVFKPAWEAFDAWMFAEFARFKQDLDKFWNVELKAIWEGAKKEWSIFWENDLPFIIAAGTKLAKQEWIRFKDELRNFWNNDIMAVLEEAADAMDVLWDRLMGRHRPAPGEFTEDRGADRSLNTPAAAAARAAAGSGPEASRAEALEAQQALTNDPLNQLAPSVTPSPSEMLYTPQMPAPIRTGPLDEDRLERDRRTMFQRYGGGGGFQLPARQHGGQVRSGMPYMVGETGREMFIPNADGSIAPMRAGLSIDSHRGPRTSEALNRSRLTAFNASVGAAAMSVRNFTDALDDATDKLIELFGEGGAGGGGGGAGGGGRGGGGGRAGGGRWGGGGPFGGRPTAPGAPGAPGGIGMGGGIGTGGGGGFGPYGAPGSEFMGGGGGGGYAAPPSGALGADGGGGGYTGGSGSGATRASGDLATNQKLAYDTFRELGYDDKSAKIAVGNLSGESLRNPGDTHADPSRRNPGQRAHGIASWDQSRAARIQKQFGKSPEQMTVPEQVRALDWELKTHYGGAYADLTNPNLTDEQRMYGLVKKFEAPADPSGQTAVRMGLMRGLDVEGGGLPGAGGMPPIPTGQFTGEHVLEQQQQVAGIRKQALDERTRAVLEYAGRQTGLQAQVYSGGQAGEGEGGPRTGSTRHDHGLAADLKLFDPVSGRTMHMGNPDDARRMEDYMAATVKAGATGVGAGEGYMGSQSMHVGFGKQAAWGGAPWVERAHARGMAERLTPEQLAASLGGEVPQETIGTHDEVEEPAALQQEARNLNMAKELQRRSEEMTKARGRQPLPPPGHDAVTARIPRSRTGHTGMPSVPEPKGVTDARMPRPRPGSEQALLEDRASRERAAGYTGGGPTSGPPTSTMAARMPHARPGARASYPGSASDITNVTRNMDRGFSAAGRGGIISGGGLGMLPKEMQGAAANLLQQGGDPMSIISRLMGQGPQDIATKLMGGRNALNDLMPLAQSVALGRGAVDVQLHLDKNLIAAKPAIQQAANFDLGVNVDRTGFPHSRPGDPAFTPPLPFG